MSVTQLNPSTGKRSSTHLMPSKYIKEIPLRNLSVVWVRAQRPLRPHKVREIAESFDFDLLDPLVVTGDLGDGTHHLADGQHRHAALTMLFGPDAEVACRVVDVDDPAKAAAIFRAINKGRTKPSAIEDFLVGVTAGGKAECAINKIVTELGYYIAHDKAPHCICAVRALTNVYNVFGAEALKEALMTIKCTWNEDVNALDGPIIEGFGRLVANHRGHIDWKRLREQIAKTYTPARLLGQAKVERDVHGGTMSVSVARALVRAYNKGMRSGKLSLAD